MKQKMTKEDIAFVAGIIGALAGVLGMMASAACAWYAREAVKRRGRHRR